jgi:hypothetical protein
VFSALLPLLLRPHVRLQHLPAFSSKYEAMWYELVVKCTIKATKALQQATEVGGDGGDSGVCCSVWVRGSEVPEVSSRPPRRCSRPQRLVGVGGGNPSNQAPYGVPD